jgi:soluble P-type ATPase
MIEIEIPGYHTLRLDRLVLDFNGTLARDGRLIGGVRERLKELLELLEIHVLTADTFGTVCSELGDSGCILGLLPPDEQARGKLEYIRQLGPDGLACIGNGRNDRLMLGAAALGIAVVLEEGVAMEALQSADIVCRSIVDALDLLIHPLRLVATLRS